MKKCILTSLLLLFVANIVFGQEKVIIYKHVGNPTVFNVSDVDSIKFVYEEEREEPSDFKPTTGSKPNAVDLGLPSGTKWASWNYGASNEYSNGGYYGWGDPSGNLTFADKSSDYYRFDHAQSIAGTEYDLITEKYGKNWSLPTLAQYEELFDSRYTDVQLINNYNGSGMNGWVITSKKKTNNKIFLPNAGYVNVSGLKNFNAVTYYWTSQCADIYVIYANISAADNVFGSESPANLQLPIRGVYNENQGGGGETGGDQLVDKDGKDPTANPNAGYAVDLGLNVLWATYNIGAKDEADFGSHFAWGCSSTQADYSDSSYPHRNKSISAYKSEYSAEILNDNYDTAHNIWGGKWVMPTNDDFIDLENYCTFELTEKNGVVGYTVTSKRNGNSIFLPAGGFKSGSETVPNYYNTAGYYWSRTADSKTTNSKAYYMGFTQTQTPYNTTALRNLGYNIRPVIRKN